MISPISNINSVHAAYQPSKVEPQKLPEGPPPIDQPKDAFTKSRASDLDHDSDGR